MLHIHRAERADGLVEALGRLLADPLPDPFAPDVISVPTRGMERWLTQRLSSTRGAPPGGADGVCANVEFPFPHRLAGDAVATASGVDPAADPWTPARARWPPLDGGGGGPPAPGPFARCRPSSAGAPPSRGCGACASTSAARTTPTAARAGSQPCGTWPS